MESDLGTGWCSGQGFDLAFLLKTTTVVYPFKTNSLYCLQSAFPLKIQEVAAF